MREIHLHGELSRFGGPFRFDVSTAGEAVTALCANIPEIHSAIGQGSWRVMRGDPKTGLSLALEDISSMKLGKGDLHLIPEVAGAKNRGIGKVILGAALIAASFGSAAFLSAPLAGGMFGAKLTVGAALGKAGLVMALSGVSALLAPQQEAMTSDSDSSFMFTGPTAGGSQGMAVPIVYGEVLTQGIVISGGIDAMNIKTGRPTGNGLTDLVWRAAAEAIP